VPAAADELEGPAAKGQTIHFSGRVLGRDLRFIFKVEDVDPERYQLDRHVFFPWGLPQARL
jgi:hypothetical protein